MRNKSAVLCALFALSPAVSLASFSFTDNFTPSPSPLWSNAAGNWTASGGDYLAQNPFAANTGETGAFSDLPFDLTDFTVSVNVNSLGDGGLWLRTDGTATNGVLLVTGGNGYGQGARGGGAGNSLYWQVFKNGVIGPEEGQVTGVFTTGSNYQLSVSVTGDVYSAYVNGSSTPATTLTDSTFSSGEVGLYDDQPGIGGSGPAQSFSDFSVQGTLVPEPASLGVLSLGLMAALRRRNRNI